MFKRINEGHTQIEISEWMKKYDNDVEKKSFDWFYCLKDTWALVKSDEHKKEMEDIIREHVFEIYGSKRIFFNREHNIITFDYDGEEIEL
jgi:hypothetical protein